MSTLPIYIGLDVGGSKTELLARTPNGTDDVCLSGPGANAQRLGHDATAHVLAELIQKALRHCPEGRLAAVCAGIAGAGQAGDQEALSRCLLQALDTPHTPSPHIRIVHDAQVALEAAFEAESGLVVIVGTGSVVFARTRTGELQRTGGWGYLLGDEGSGFALGQSGLRAVTHAIDGGPETILRTWVAERHDLKDRQRLIHRIYQDNWPVQEVAPLVIEAAQDGDAVARGLVEQQTHLLARQVEWLLDRCDDIEPRLALMGGLVRETYYAEALRRALEERLSGWSIQRLDRRPVVGALRLACRTAA